MKKKIVLITMIGLTTAYSLFAQERAALSITGPSSWVRGTKITVAVQDKYINLGGSYAFSHWLVVDTTIAPFLSIAGLRHFPSFPEGYNGPFPIFFDQNGGEPVDLGGGGNLVPDGSYHVTNITFAVAAGAPVGTYTLRTTTAPSRQSIQTDHNFNDVGIPQASFVFNVVP